MLLICTSPRNFDTHHPSWDVNKMKTHMPHHRPFLKALSNRCPIKVVGPKPTLLCSCLATGYFLVTGWHWCEVCCRKSWPKLLLRMWHICDLGRDRRQTCSHSVMNSSLSVGAHPWVMTQTCPPPVSSLLSTMRLAPLSFAPSRGNEAGHSWPDSTGATTLFPHLMVIFFSLSASWCEVRVHWFKR